MAEAVTRDLASFNWLKLAAVCLFRAQSVSKNKSICDCDGQDRKVIGTKPSYLLSEPVVVQFSCS